MKPPQINSHPIVLVPRWLASIGHGWSAHFSRYVYKPQSLNDQRVLMQLPLERVTERWLEQELSDLEPNQELAMHSLLVKGRRIRHIPMVDFAAKTDAIDEVVRWADHDLRIHLQLFSSGRSFHTYGLEPVPQSAWLRLMGMLLLANLPNQPPVIDTRWVGHRLLGGYASLRWSKNTTDYAAWPTLLQSSDLRSYAAKPGP